MIKFGRPFIRDIPVEQIMEIIYSGQLRGGGCLKELESVFCENTGCKYCIGVSSGTAALYLICFAEDIKGKEVILPALAHLATVSAVVRAGGIPVIVDVDDSATLSPDAIKRALSSNTGAILPVHMFGYSAKMSEIINIAKSKNVKIIEDCAYGPGIFCSNNHIGTQASGGAISFGVLKPITCGEGGMVITNSEEVADSVIQNRNYGFAEHNKKVGAFGLNFKLNEISAIIALEQMNRFSDIINKKYDIYTRYKNNLKNVVDLLEPNKDTLSNYCFTVVKLPDTKHSQEAVKWFREHDIEVQAIHPLHKLENLLGEVKTSGPLSYAEYLGDHLLCLPSHSLINETEITYISDMLRKYVVPSLA